MPPAQVALKRVGQEWGITVSFRSTRRFWAAQRKWYWRVKEDHEYNNGKHNRISLNPLRANIAETLLVPLITEQGGKEIQHEEYEDILSGPAGRAQ